MRTFIGALVCLACACGDGGSATPADAQAADAQAADAQTADAQTADASTKSIVETYASAWGEADPTARGRLLAFSAVETLTVEEPTRTLASRDQVDAAIAQFLAETPGGSVPILGNVREAHDRVWIRWDVRNGSGGTIFTGLDLMKRAGDQRLERVHSFFGALPATPGTHTPVQQALIDAWNQPDSGMRTTLLQTALADDVVVVLEDEPTSLTGRAPFSAVIANRLAANPGRTYSLTSGYLALPNAFHAAWRASDGTTTTSGVMMAVLAGDGRIAELVYFDGAQP